MYGSKSIGRSSRPLSDEHFLIAGAVNGLRRKMEGIKKTGALCVNGSDRKKQPKIRKCTPTTSDAQNFDQGSSATQRKNSRW